MHIHDCPRPSPWSTRPDSGDQQPTPREIISGEPRIVATAAKRKHTHPEVLIKYNRLTAVVALSTYADAALAASMQMAEDVTYAYEDGYSKFLSSPSPALLILSIPIFREKVLWFTCISPK
jgi:hypothetical protein